MVIDTHIRAIVHQQVRIWSGFASISAALIVGLLVFDGFSVATSGASLLGVLLGGLSRWRRPVEIRLSETFYYSGPDAIPPSVRTYVDSFGTIGFRFITGLLAVPFIILVALGCLYSNWWSDATVYTILIAFLIGGYMTATTCWLSVYLRIIRSWRTSPPPSSTHVDDQRMD